MVGIFNTIWLLPVYFTTTESSEADRVVKTTIANVPEGSHRLYATVFASYVFFGYTMYLLLKEFEWYIEMRHKFLRKPLARHFTVFVRNIPLEYRTNPNLVGFFRSCFSDEDVLEAQLAMNIPNLSKAVAQRDATLASLEHALALYNKSGSRPRHKDKLVTLGGKVDSIDCYSAKLEEQNKDVALRIETLEPITRGFNPMSGDPIVAAASGDETDFQDEGDKPSLFMPTDLYTAVNASDQDGNATELELNDISGITTNTAVDHIPESDLEVDSGAGQMPQSDGDGNRLLGIGNNLKDAASGVMNRSVALVLGGEDGEVFAAGFVVFSKLSTTNAALQMVHQETPFAMEVVEAPDPEDGKF